MPRTALITGGTGLLGREVVKAFGRAGWKSVGTGLTRADPPSIVKLDLLDEAEIESVLDDVKPHAVVHCAAHRSPDLCNSNPSLAFALNSTSTRVLASHTFRRGILLLYISTDYVFSGRPGEAPYTPDDPTDPPNTYGKSKAEGEVGVLKETGGSSCTSIKHDVPDRQDGARDANRETKGDNGDILGLILRVPLLYGTTTTTTTTPHASDPSQSSIHVLLAQLRAAQLYDPSTPRLRIDAYAQRYPTCTTDVARVCVGIATLYLHRRGEALPRVLHFSAEERMTRWEMAGVLAGMTGWGLEGCEAWDPTREEEEEEQGKGGPVRPFDCHLDTGVLGGLGVGLECVGFAEWWEKELARMGMVIREG